MTIKEKPIRGLPDGRGPETGVNADSIEHYTQSQPDCQVLDLADTCLKKHRFHRSRYVATGDAADFRLALAYQQDRERLLKDLNNRIEGA